MSGKIGSSLMIALLFMTTPVFGAEKNVVEVRDDSASGCPIAVSGNVTFMDDDTNGQHSIAVHGNITNTSESPVLFVKVAFELRGAGKSGANYTRTQDYFFRVNGLQSRSSDILESLLGPFTDPPNAIRAEQNAERSASAIVEFVQLEDGSSWGDPNVVQEDLQARNLTISQLHMLDSSIREKGEQAFVAQLLQSKTLLLPALTSVVEGYQRTGDIQAAKASVQAMVDAATHHGRLAQPFGSPR